MAFRPGDHFVICDQCGFKRYASDCKMTWNHLFVCADTCWEPKHPHFKPPRPKGEKQSVTISRPEKTDVFITENITADDL